MVCLNSLKNSAHKTRKSKNLRNYKSKFFSHNNYKTIFKRSTTHFLICIFNCGKENSPFRFVLLGTGPPLLPQPSKIVLWSHTYMNLQFNLIVLLDIKNMPHNTVPHWNQINFHKQNQSPTPLSSLHTISLKAIFIVNVP